MGTNPVESIKQGLSRWETLAQMRVASQNRTLMTIDNT
jgi:hypothetical protein